MTPTRLAIILIVAVFALQVVPYGRDHSNPPATSEPEWDSAGTRETFHRVCGDCHSNETVWPWYSNVAPVSWLVQHDVDEGREHFNVSQWKEQKQHGDEAVEMVEEGEMPPWFYLPLHPESQLSAQETDTFVAGLKATFGTEHDEHEHDDEGH